jgi:hypothetical protein
MSTDDHSSGDDERASRDDGRADEYRSAVFGAVPVAHWREILETACREALAGDQRAREWVQRVLGVADAIRTHGALDDLAERISHSEFLNAVERTRAAAYRASAQANDGASTRQAGAGGATAPPRQNRPDAAGGPYWREVFSVVTPEIWERIVAGACADAIEGEPRARDWLAKVLGTENIVDAQGLVEAQSTDVTIGTLMREIQPSR